MNTNEVQLSGASGDHRKNMSDLDLFLQEGLKTIDIDKLTPVQSSLIGQYHVARDVVCIAQPNQGSTIGAIIAILKGFDSAWDPERIKAIFVAPTSDLAWFIYHILMHLLPWTGLLPQPLIEGSKLPQSKLRSWSYHLIVATPNLIGDAIVHSRIQAQSVTHVLFDRADLMGGGEQFQRFCRDIDGYGTRILTAHHEIPQNVKTLCLQRGRAVEVRPIPAQRSVVLNFIARPADEGPWATILGYIRTILPQGDQILVVTNTMDILTRDLELQLGGGSPVGVIHDQKTKEEQDEAISFFTRGQSRVLVAPEVPDLKLHKASTVLFLPPPMNLEVIMKGVDQLKPANGQLVVLFRADTSSERRKSVALGRQYIQTVENAKVIWTDNGTAIWDSSTVPQHPSCDVDAAPSSRLLVIGVPRAWNNWEVLSAMSKHAPLDMDRKMISVGEWEHFRDVSAATGCLKEWDANILGNNIIRMCYASAPVKDESQDGEDGGRKKRVKVEVIE